MATADEHLEALLKLPPEERLRIAQLLYASVDAAPEIEAAWQAELERRIRSVQDGTARLVPWPEVKRQIREHLQRLRTARSGTE